MYPSSCETSTAPVTEGLVLMQMTQLHSQGNWKGHRSCSDAQSHGTWVVYLSSEHPLPISSYKLYSDTRFLLADKADRYVHCSQGNSVISPSFYQHCLTRSDKQVPKWTECSWGWQERSHERARVSCIGWVNVPACRRCCLTGFPLKCLEITDRGQG